MPKAGFYVRPPSFGKILQGPQMFRTSGNIVYTTGVTGGGGHKMWRGPVDSTEWPEVLPTSINDFWTLQWSSVPGKNELSQEYRYAETLEEALVIYKNNHLICNGWGVPYTWVNAPGPFSNHYASDI